MKRFELLFALLLTLALVSYAAPAHATGVVTHCQNDTELVSELVGGGTITFNCGKATIILTNTQQLTADTIIDGGSKITLSGDDARQLFTVDNGVTVQFKNIKLVRGFGSKGGALQNHGTLRLDHVTIQDSNADYGGGAIFSDNTLEVLNSTLTHNTALLGAAIDNELIIPIQTAPHRAPLSAPSVVIQNSLLTHNTAGTGGGALYNKGDASLFNATVSYNTANYSGGGVANAFNGNTTILSSAFISNSAIFGGGVENIGSTVVMTSSTFSQNYASDTGGGLDNVGGNASLWNVTFVGSGSVHPGAGIYSSTGSGGSIFARNVLLADSPTGGNCYIIPAGVTPGSNMSSDNTCNFGTGRDNINPLLGALSSNGGLTQSYMPQTGSPAIDGGEPVDCAANDQRGVLMPKGSACDVGSIEVCTAKPFAATLTSPGDGKKAKGLKVKLKWSLGYCATSYTVTVKADSKKGKKVFSAKSLDVTAIKTTPLTRGKTYYWVVKTCNSVGCAKSPGSTFTVK